MRILLLILILGMVVCSEAHAASVCFKDVCVQTEVEKTLEDQRRGLQGRQGLEENHGMLFVFTNDDYQSFWMKDMNFSIDMIWINNQNQVVKIVASCPPCLKDPCEIYTPQQKARYVLEVPSGFSEQHGLKEGDVVKFNEVI